jgi:glycosyltransferase involved in cell wall biosynthesis
MILISGLDFTIWNVCKPILTDNTNIAHSDTYFPKPHIKNRVQLKIAISTTSLKQPLTGLGHYTQNLIWALRSTTNSDLIFFDGAQWSVTASIKPQRVNFNALKILRRLPFAYQANRFLGQLSFWKGLQKDKVEIYHELNFLAFKCKFPTIITVHDLSWIRFPEVHPPSRVREMNRFFERGIKRASHIITDAEFIRQEFIQQFNYPADRVTAIPLGVNESFNPFSQEETRATLTKHELKHGNYILAVGTLEPRKNLIVAIDAFLLLPKVLRQKYPLVIAGSKGWLLGELEKKLNPLIQSGEVRLLGYVPQDELPHIIAGALTLIFPSIYEGFGLPPLEAMACGVPVIASNNSSIPEVVDDTGILLNSNDTQGFSEAMKSLIEDPILRATLSQKALERSKKFTWERCALSTLEVYKKVLAAH